MKIALVTVVAFAAVVGSMTARAEIYTCVDSEGHRTLRDTPCDGTRRPTTATQIPAPTYAPQATARVTPESLSDGDDLARIKELRARCDAAEAASNNSRTPVGGFAAATLGIAACGAYERAAKDRQRYEVLRAQNPAWGAKELEAQRAAREERRRNRPVITNCTKWAADNVTCISQ